MSQDNGQGNLPPQAPKNITVEVQMDLQAQTVTFLEKEVNGLVMVQPKTITVPAQTILVIAAQMTLAMMGIKPGAAAQISGQGRETPGPRLI